MKRTLLVLIVICSLQPANAQWKLVWSDEFSYNGLPDPAKWTNEVGFIRNNELQYYTKNRIENAEVKDGFLYITARKENYDKAGYTSASITTDGLYSFTYGRAEARMKLPKGQGMWPAFWMLGQNIHEVNWPRCGEIDIMEHINSEDVLYGTLHWHNQKHVSSGTKTACTVGEFHIYSIEWDAKTIKWFLDGKQYHEVSIENGDNSTEEFHKPFYLILNLAVGGEWPKNPDSSTVFPDNVVVDYVRVYQK